MSHLLHRLARPARLRCPTIRGDLGHFICRAELERAIRGDLGHSLCMSASKLTSASSAIYLSQVSVKYVPCAAATKEMINPVAAGRAAGGWGEDEQQDEQQR